MNYKSLVRNNNNDNKDYSFVSYINQKEIIGKDEVNLEFNLNNTNYNSDFDQIQELIMYRHLLQTASPI
jgi:hypothetical protein